MESILDEMCFYFMEKENIISNAKCERLDNKIDDLFDKLDEKHKKIFNQILDLHLELMAEKEHLYFKEGFKYGLTISMEAMLLK